MLRCLFIQQLYSLSDEQLEIKLADRISFKMFSRTTEVVPDSTTIWNFRKRLADSGIDKKMWNKLQKRIAATKLKVKTGTKPYFGYKLHGVIRGILAGFAESRLQLLKSTIARWIWLMKAKFVMLIRDISVRRQKGTMPP